jgi:hypothetical protein
MNYPNDADVASHQQMIDDQWYSPLHEVQPFEHLDASAIKIDPLILMEIRRGVFKSRFLFVLALSIPEAVEISFVTSNLMARHRSEARERQDKASPML